MILDLKPYPKYKGSGVPWIGEVPEHWVLNPNRAYLRMKKEIVGDRHSLHKLLSLTKVGIIIRDISTGKGKFSADMGTSQIVRRGDLVFCLFDIPETPRTIGLSSHEGIITSAYTVFECRNADIGQYLELYYCSLDDRKLLSPLYSGLRNTIPPSRFLTIRSPIPPQEDRDAIIRFLHHADRKIRRFILTKQKLIKLLEEQKRTIIHQAVTRGLNPNVRLKPSGVEWLGDVPEHWEVRRLRYLIEGRLSYGANAAAEHDNPEWPRYLRITDFGRDGTIRNDTFRSLPPDLANDYLVEAGDILLARSGATVGKAFLVTSEAGEACHAGYLIRARPKLSLIIPKYLFSFTQSQGFTRWKDSTFIIATIQNIGADKYADLPVPLPPVAEQVSIMQFLEDATGTIGTTIERAKREISLLHEYRTRLIADVVTGKLDVRAAAATLPDEIEPVDVIETLTDDEGDIMLDAIEADDELAEAI